MTLILLNLACDVSWHVEMLRRRALFEKNTKTSSHKQNRKGRKYNYQGLSPGDNGSSDTEPVVVGAKTSTEILICLLQTKRNFKQNLPNLGNCSILMWCKTPPPTEIKTVAQTYPKNKTVHSYETNDTIIKQTIEIINDQTVEHVGAAADDRWFGNRTFIFSFSRREFVVVSTGSPGWVSFHAVKKDRI